MACKTEMVLSKKATQHFTTSQPTRQWDGAIKQFCGGALTESLRGGDCDSSLTL